MEIPKIIHYCWFGGNEKPDYVKKYIQTWKILKGYKVVEWNEKNFDLNSNDFIRFAYKNKKWAFVADYVRLKVLQEFGGIYLDTDVEIKKNFTELLSDSMFLGLIYDCSIGTAVIGAIPNHKIINEILNMYDSCEFDIINNKIIMKFKDYEKYKINNNNDLFTVYFINRVHGFRLCNENQQLKDINIYKKEYFERETFNKKIDYSVHHCYGSWYKQNPNKKSILAKFVRLFIGNTFYDKLLCFRKKSKLPYYNVYLRDKKKVINND